MEDNDYNSTPSDSSPGIISQAAQGSGQVTVDPSATAGRGSDWTGNSGIVSRAGNAGATVGWDSAPSGSPPAPPQEGFLTRAARAVLDTAAAQARGGDPENHQSFWKRPPDLTDTIYDPESGMSTPRYAPTAQPLVSGAAGAGFGLNDRGAGGGENMPSTNIVRSAAPPPIVGSASFDGGGTRSYTQADLDAASGRSNIVSGGSGMTTEQANEVYGRQNRIMDATNLVRNAARGQSIDREANQSRLDAAAPTPGELDRAASTARVANFDAANAARAIANNIGPKGPNARASLGVIAQAAQNAQNESDALRNKAATPQTAPSPNYVQNAASITNAGQQARSAETGQQAAQQGLQKGQYDLQHASVVNGLAQLLANTSQSDPNYAQRLTAYRTMIGKDANRWETKVVPGGTRFDPANPTVPIKDPDYVVTHDLYGNEPPHYLPLPPSQGALDAASTAGLSEGTTRTKGSVKQVLKGGKWVDQ